MKTNPNDAISGQQEALNQYCERPHTVLVGGLTKREYFAAAAMQGMMANADAINRVWKSSKALNSHDLEGAATNACTMHIAEIAVLQADFLIEALNKKEQE